MDEDGSDRIELDLQTQKTEGEWQSTLDRFWLAVTPLWFTWLEWVALLGVLSYLAETTRATVLMVAVSLSYTALFFYFFAVFFRLEIRGFPRVKSPRRPVVPDGWRSTATSAR